MGIIYFHYVFPKVARTKAKYRICMYHLSTLSFPLLVIKIRRMEKTHPVGCADSLVIDAVAFLRQQRGVPVAVVGLVVTHSKRLRRVDPCSRELSSEVVLGVQQRGILEVNGNWVAAQDFCCASCSAWTFLLHHHLVGTANTMQKQNEQTPIGQAATFAQHCWQYRRFSWLALQSIKKKASSWMAEKHAESSKPQSTPSLWKSSFI